MIMVQGVFTAGDGDLSIVYQAAAHIWGSWGANYSEGVEPEDFEEDRALGFVGDVGDTGGELASRMWVRADVSTDQDAQTSTVPTIFRDARERTSGDVVVNREISGAGLGGLVPYVDFRHGDEIGTVIGSKVVPLPVNGIQFTTDVNGGRDYIVAVGKGLLGNVRERDARNAALEAQIRAETAERERRIEEEAKRQAEAAVRPINTDLDKALDLYNGGALEIGKDSRFTWITEQNQQADAVIDEKVETLNRQFVPVKNLVNAQISVNGALRTTVGTMDGIVNGDDPPQVNSNLWRLNTDAWNLQTAFNEAQTTINQWVSGAINALDRRIPVGINLGGSASGVGSFTRSGDNVVFTKSFSEPCNLLFVVALEAIDSYAFTTTRTLGSGSGGSAYVSPGLLQNITTATVTVFRMTEMPRINLPEIIEFAPPPS